MECKWSSKQSWAHNGKKVESNYGSSKIFSVSAVRILFNILKLMGCSLIKMTKYFFLKISSITKHKGVTEMSFAKIIVCVVKRYFVSGSCVRGNIAVFRKNTVICSFWV